MSSGPGSAGCMKYHQFPAPRRHQQLLDAQVGLVETLEDRAPLLVGGDFERALDQLAPVHVVEVVVEAERVGLVDVVHGVLPLLEQPVEPAVDDVLGGAAGLEELAHRIFTSHQ